jgi:hypothetical protein
MRLLASWVRHSFVTLSGSHPTLSNSKLMTLNTWRQSQFAPD